MICSHFLLIPIIVEIPLKCGVVLSLFCFVSLTVYFYCRYVSFDFHHVCGNSNFDNLQILYDQISEYFEKQG